MIQCGIVGWKNSGKTYLAQKLINYYTNKNYKVAAIKHAHHDFDIDKEGTDSFLLREAGAEQVIISSAKRWAKITELKNKEEMLLDKLILELESPDILIIEGFKNLSHPKIEIINDNNYLFSRLKNVVCIVSDEKINTEIPQYKIIEIEKIANLILENQSNE